jgi:chorismate dehydratase
MFDIEFRVPAGCADQLAAGAADIGIVPSFELTRQDLEIIPGVGIACRGAVRSILLISKCPAGQIRTLAVDASSRTSVELARVILARKYGAEPVQIPMAPDPGTMLGAADAALIIGDPALRIDPAAPDPAGLGKYVYDLGAEWQELTGLPMVFAVWAGRKGVVTPEIGAAFRASYRFGLEHMDEIVATESAVRGFAPEVVREYLTRYIVHELGPREYQALEIFLEYARPEGVESLNPVTRV